jgi:uncharacterized membrane protein YhaH (DUF805 family)
MAGLWGAHSARFMFRDDKGSIDRASWWRAMAVLVVALALLGGLVLALDDFLPKTPEAAEALVNQAAQTHNRLLSVPYYASLLIIDISYVLMILVSVCVYFVGAKRFNDLGRPAQMALILPAVIYVQIFSPILSDQLLPIYGRWLVNVAVVAVLAWQLYLLGFTKGRL